MPLQVATVNHRDGFFLVGRKAGNDFQWKDLEGAELVTSNFSLQPLASLGMCLSEMPEVDADKIRIADNYENMAAAARPFATVRAISFICRNRLPASWWRKAPGIWPHRWENHWAPWPSAPWP